MLPLKNWIARGGFMLTRSPVLQIGEIDVVGNAVGNVVGTVGRENKAIKNGLARMLVHTAGRCHMCRESAKQVTDSHE